jgi:hypothetical protein
MGVITHLGSYTGGRKLIKLGPDFLVVAAFSMIIYYWARAAALPVGKRQMRRGSRHGSRTGDNRLTHMAPLCVKTRRGRGF